jgi:hypothetical protein
MDLIVLAFVPFVAQFVGALVHELGHATAGSLMGIRIEKLVLNSGPVLWQVGKGTVFEIRTFPGQGLTFRGPVSPRCRRLRLGVFVAGGTLGDLALLTAILVTLRETDLPGLAVFSLLFFAARQIFQIAMNLWPQIVTVNDFTVANDGLQLVRLIRNTTPPDGFDEFYTVFIARYLTSGEALPSGAARSQIIADYALLRAKRGVLPPELIERIEVELSTMAVCEQLFLLDGLITEGLADARADKLPDLDRWSARAFDLAPDLQTIRSSRGSVLIELGEVTAGLELLSTGLTGDPHNDCLVHAFRALGLFSLGDEDRAKASFTDSSSLFDHERWHGQVIERIVLRIGRTIGEDLPRPTTWSADMAGAALRT